MLEIGKWHARRVVVIALAVGAIALFVKEATTPSVYGVCTVGYNYREKPIYSFSVATPEGSCGNNVGGKNPDEIYSGGGGVACGCSIRPGETATVKWSMEQTRDEFDHDAPIENHQSQVIIPPPESHKARYLQVHFLADNKVVLDWRDDISFSRVDPKTGKILNLGSGWIDPETGKIASPKGEN